MTLAQASPRLEDLLARWATPPSQTEQDRCSNAETAIRRAVAASVALQNRDITVFTHGSYRNRVNVRQNSDVDVGVLCKDTFYYGLPSGTSPESFGIIPAFYGYSQFKNELEQALVNCFGRVAVKRGDKAFDVKETAHRVEADVAPFFEYRAYRSNGSYDPGVKLTTDAGKEIINWPEQHYQNAVAKNSRTSRAFKGIVRILKQVALVVEQETGVNTPGFLVECMAHNAPDAAFMYPTWHEATREVLVNLFNATLSEAGCSTWTEVSGLKYLFAPNQKWTWQDAHKYATAAWAVLGFS